MAGSAPHRHPKTGIWQIRWYEIGPDGNPRQRQKSCPGMTQAEAARELARIQADVSGGSHVEPRKMTIGEYMLEWLEVRRQQLSVATALEYSREIRRTILPALGGIRLHQLRAMHLNRFYAELLAGGGRAGRGLSPKSIRNIHGLIHAALESAVRWDYLPRNPAANVDPPKVRRREVRAADRAGIIRLLESLDRSRYRIPVLIALGTGMRRGEIAGLRWDDFDEERGRLIVRRSIAQLPGPQLVEKSTKSGEPRVVPIPPALMDALVAHRAWQAEQTAAFAEFDAGGWICVDTDGRRLTPTGMTAAFWHLARRAKLGGATLHGLRHTQGTELLNAGVPSAIVSKRLGHSTIDITHRIYYHALPEAQQAAVAAAQELLTLHQQPRIRVVGDDSDEITSAQ
jgi:integrase